MANRTIQFLGNGYAPTGADPVTITATLNGSVVYTGSIPTSYTSEVDHSTEDQRVLFTCELPVNFAGTMPMTISINGPMSSTVFFEQIQSNYMTIINPVFTAEDLAALANPATPRADKVAIWTARAVPSLSAEDIAILETGNLEQVNTVRAAHNLQTYISAGPGTFLAANGAAESRSNVVINGSAQTRQTAPEGTWGWTVEFPAEGSGLFECDVTVIAGLE